MMNKILSKTVRKTTLLSTIFTIILAAAIVVLALCGFNRDVTMENNNTLTVSINSFAYDNKKDEVVSDCEDLFDRMRVKYIMEGEMAGDKSEIVFVCNSSTEISDIAIKVNEHFAKKVAEVEGWENVEILAKTGSEKTHSVWAKDFALRSSVALVAFVALTFAYVAIRYQKPSLGLVGAACVAVGMLLTASLIVLTRTFVTDTLPAVLGLSGMLTAALTLFTIGKIRAKQKEDASLSDEQAVLSAIPATGILVACGSLAVASVVLGIVGKTAVAWFAVCMLISLVSAACVALFFTPALYLSVKTWLGNRPAKNAYVGAKKSSKKSAKAAATAEEVSVEATPVEEAAEETVEEIAEENVEETVEEVAEETATEATEE